MLAAFFSRDLRTARLPVPGDHEQKQLFQPRQVAGNHALEAGIECGLEGMGRLYDCRISRTRLIPDERVMNALHKMQDYLQQTKVISQRRHKSKTHQGRMEMPLMRRFEATTQARDRQQEARGFFGIRAKNVKRPQKPRRSSCKKRNARETRQDRDHEGGGLGDHGGRLLQDAPRSPRSLNELSAQLSQQNTATRSTQ